MYAYTHTHTHVHTHTHTHVRAHTHTHTHTHKCRHRTVLLQPCMTHIGSQKSKVKSIKINTLSPPPHGFHAIPSSQSLPVYPGPQTQMKPLSWSTQDTVSLLHGELLHSSISAGIINHPYKDHGDMLKVKFKFQAPWKQQCAAPQTFTHARINSTAEEHDEWLSSESRHAH